MEIKVGVVGATGYAGAELVRLLLNHPYAKLTASVRSPLKGQKLSEVISFLSWIMRYGLQDSGRSGGKMRRCICRIASRIISGIGSSLCQTYEILY